MGSDLQVANDVYERFGLKWADFPTLVTPSAHSDEAELFCAKQAMAVYGVYPGSPYAPDHDYIPSRQRQAIAAEAFSVSDMIEGGADLAARDFEAERGFRAVVADQAGALLVWRDDHLVIAFRGTANWQDWIHNLTGATITIETIPAEADIRLHKGFTGLTENLFPAAVELIAEFIHKRSRHGRNVSLTLCGHSLGGALALNFAMQLQPWGAGHLTWRRRTLFGDGLRLGATYTFGAPSIGVGEVWRTVVRPHYRLIVRGDPVPLTPPGFSHDFQATYLEMPSRAAVQPKGPMGMIRKALATIGPAIGFNASAHDIEGYIEAIERKIGAKP